MILFFCAAVPRIVALMLTIDIPGDGPSRAVKALRWAQDPVLIDHGTWLPGHQFIVGPLCLVFGDAQLAPRLFNVLSGSATVAVLYLLASVIFGRFAALLGAALLTFLPLHVGLSASSLTEVLFLLLLFLGLALLIRSVEQPKFANLYLSGSAVSLGLAELTRYEAWPVVLPVVLYYGLATRSPGRTVILLVLLSIIPIWWSYGNYLHLDDALHGFKQAVRGAEAVGASAVGWWAGLQLLFKFTILHLGWLVFIVLILGLAIELGHILLGRTSLRKLLYLAILAGLWLIAWRAAAVRGISLWDRYLLFAFAMSLPLAGVTLNALRPSPLRWLGLAILLAGILYETAPRYNEPANIYVTRDKALEIRELAQWLRENGHTESPMLFTKMEWKSGYVHLFLPEIRRSRIVSYWLDEADLQRFLSERPKILVTASWDESHVRRVQKALRYRFSPKDVLYSEDGIIVLKMPQAGTAASPMQ